MVRIGVAGMVGHGLVSFDLISYVLAGELWLGWARRVRLSQAWFGEAGEVLYVAVRQAELRSGLAWQAWPKKSNKEQGVQNKE